MRVCVGEKIVFRYVLVTSIGFAPASTDVPLAGHAILVRWEERMRDEAGMSA